MTKELSTIFDSKVPQRAAWRMLAADFSDKKDITVDRWRALQSAFVTVDDELLLTAVLQHLHERPQYFPRIGDIMRQLEPLLSYADRLKLGMWRIGFRFVEDVHHEYHFEHLTNGRRAVIHH